MNAAPRQPVTGGLCRGATGKGGGARASLRSDLRTCAAAGKELAQSGWKVERVREAAAGIDLQCLWRGGRPPSSGSVENRGARGLPGKEGGGRWAEQFSNQETVSHCSLTPLTLGGKDHEVLDIHQPAGEGRLPGARVCFPPPSPRQWDPVRLSQGSRLGRADPGHRK